MKIIYLANIRIPTEKAHGLQIIKMCQAFVREGADLELIAAKRVNSQFKGINPFDYYRSKERFPIKRLWLIDTVAIDWSFWGMSAFIQNVSFAFSSFIYLLFRKADIIYSRDEFSLFLLSFFRKNLVLELHTFPNSKFFLYRHVFKKVKKIIVINNKLKGLAVGLGIKPKKILVAPDGVDLKQFKIKESQVECRQKLDLPADKKLAVYAGHLYRWKGVYTLAEASRFLSDDFRIIFVGGIGKDKDKFEEFIKQEKFDKIVIIGHQPPELIPFYLKAADVLVLPNSAREKISRLYTSPLKMFEYMASGMPIIASNLSSLKEVLNRSNSLLFQPDNPKDLAEKILTALGNRQISQQALIDVQKYAWQKRAKNILEFIQK